MKKYLVLVLAGLMLLGSASSAFASKSYSSQTPVHVDGYTKKDGTRVSEHYRAKPGKGCGGHGCHR